MSTQLTYAHVPHVSLPTVIRPEMVLGEESVFH